MRQIKHAVDSSSDIAKVKMKTARYFFDMILPEQKALVAIIEAGKDPMMDFDPSEL